MDIEQVALFDLYLKSIPKYGLQNIINVDNMIVLDASTEQIKKLNTGAKNLNNVKAYIKPGDLKEWESALKEQVRISIDRAKKFKSQEQ